MIGMENIGMESGMRYEIRRIEKEYVEFGKGEDRLRVTPIRDSIIRCTAFRKGKAAAPMLVQKEAMRHSCGWTLQKSPAGWEIHTGKLAVRIDCEQGTLTYETLVEDPKQLLREGVRELKEKKIYRYVRRDTEVAIRKTVDGERAFAELIKEEAGEAYEAVLHLKLGKDEAIHGFGQAEEGIWDYRYQKQYLYPHNLRIPMPFFLSSKGYGMLIDSGCPFAWEGGTEDSRITLDTVSQLDTFLIAGETPDEIIRGYRFLTGQAVMLPRWVFGYIQSREMYTCDMELLEVVKEYRRRGIPIDCVVQDWNTWVPGHWGEKRLDPERYGDIEACLEEIHRLKAHAMVSIWPTAAKGTQDHEEFAREGYLLADDMTYNAFDPGARKRYWQQAKAGLYDKGFDAWWCDSTEPFGGSDWCGETRRGDEERYLLVSGEHKTYLRPDQANLYAMMHAKGIYENQRAADTQHRVVNLTRSGYASAQKYGAILWSGDISASWSCLKKQITEGLQMGLSGYPYWTMDIGAFFTVREKWWKRGCGNSNNPNPLWFWNGDYEDGAEDPAYRELYTRWLQMGVFLPMFRSHGTDTPREIWNFGEPGTMFYDTIASFIRLRYRLMPYIYSCAAAVTLEDATMMRSLIFDFAEDTKAAQVQDGFLFGPSLLVYPVTEPMYYDRNGVALDREKTKECYLPKGCGWFDFWTEQYYEGDQTVCVDCPIDRIPLFVRAGSILPMTEDLQYADEVTEKPVTLRVYRGADASFRLYEDAGDGYGYERGEYRVTEFCYQEETGDVSCERVHGKYKGTPMEVAKILFVG